MPNHHAYLKRFNAVLAYIEANLEADLSVNALSQVANFSAFISIDSSRRSSGCPFHAMCN